MKTDLTSIQEQQEVETASEQFRDPTLDGTTVGYNALELKCDGSEIALYNGNTLVATTSGLGLTANTWRYLEMKVYCDDTNGTYEVKLDGTTILSGTGDTKYSSTFDYYASVGFRLANGIQRYIDDLYVCDGSGTDNNDFLGDCKVLTMVPTSDASGNWTSSSGGSLYADVDEAVLDFDTSYISSNTAGEQAVFGYGGVNIGSDTIAGVMVTTCAKQTGNNAVGVKHLTQNGSGGTIHSESSIPVSNDDYICFTEVFESDSDGVGWNQSTINTARFGVEAT